MQMETFQKNAQCLLGLGAHPSNQGAVAGAGWMVSHLMHKHLQEKNSKFYLGEGL